MRVNHFIVFVALFFPLAAFGDKNVPVCITKANLSDGSMRITFQKSKKCVKYPDAINRTALVYFPGHIVHNGTLQPIDRRFLLERVMSKFFASTSKELRAVLPSFTSRQLGIFYSAFAKHLRDEAKAFAAKKRIKH